MANLYTSALVEPVSDLVDIQFAEIDISTLHKITVSKYSASDTFISVINPPTSYVENDDQVNTHIRVYLNTGQVAAGEKVKIELDE